MMICSVVAGVLVEVKLFSQPLVSGILQCVMLDTLYLPLLVIAVKGTLLWIKKSGSPSNRIGGAMKSSE